MYAIIYHKDILCLVYFLLLYSMVPRHHYTRSAFHCNQFQQSSSHHSQCMLQPRQKRREKNNKPKCLSYKCSMSAKIRSRFFLTLYRIPQLLLKMKFLFQCVEFWMVLGYYIMKIIIKIPELKDLCSSLPIEKQLT